MTRQGKTRITRRACLSGLLASPVILRSHLGLAGAGHPTVAAYGGGRMPLDWLRRTSRLAGPGRRKAVIVPYSGHRPDETFANENRFLSRFGIRRAQKLPLGEDALEMIAQADIIWFSGGSIARQMHALSKVSGAFEALRAAHQAGTVMAGGSAGASVMGEAMVGQFQSKEIFTEPGLGFLPGIAIDQHVITRGREWRMRKAIRQNPDLLGIGIDEYTGVIFENDIMSVQGKSQVIVTFWEGGLQETRLRRGDLFDLRRREKT